MIDDGLPLVITTLGAIFGPGDKDYGGTPRTGFTGYLNGELPMVPEDFVLSWDYVEDTAANIRRAMEHGEPGEEYIIASEPRSMVDVLSRAEDLTGISPPPAAPPWVFTLMGYGMQGVELVTRPPEGLESEVLQFFATGPILVDNSKAKADLGIEHRPFEERLETYLDWELDQQDLDPPNSQLA